MILLSKLQKKYDIDYFRGDENDTLSRYFKAAKKFKADLIVSVTSDCALVDPVTIDKFINIFQKKKISYLSNTYYLIDKNNFIVRKIFILMVLMLRYSITKH